MNHLPSKYLLRVDITQFLDGEETEKNVIDIIPHEDMTIEQQTHLLQFINQEGKISPKDYDFVFPIFTKMNSTYTDENLHSSYNLTKEKFDSFTGTFYIIEKVKPVNLTRGNQMKSLAHQTIDAITNGGESPGRGFQSRGGGGYRGRGGGGGGYRGRGGGSGFRGEGFRGEGFGRNNY